MAFPAVVLLVLGLGLWGLYRFTSAGERHSFAAGSVAPTYVTVTKGRTYHVSIKGGADAERSLGLDPASLECDLVETTSQSLQLAVEPEASTKALDRVGSFVAPVGGRVHVECTGLPQIFVDDADDAGFDRSGLWLLLATICLAVGLPLTLSVLRRAGQRPVRADEPYYDDGSTGP